MTQYKRIGLDTSKAVPSHYTASISKTGRCYELISVVHNYWLF